MVFWDSIQITIANAAFTDTQYKKEDIPFLLEMFLRQFQTLEIVQDFKEK